MSDRICPIMCGQCCADYWRDVPELAEAAGPSCPHEDPRGCALSREDRPPACTDYLCEIAETVLLGMISARRGMRLKMGCRRSLLPELRRARSAP